MSTLHSPNELAAWRDRVRGRIDPKQTLITVCTGTGCASAGSNKVVHRLRDRCASVIADCVEQDVRVHQKAHHSSIVW